MFESAVKRAKAYWHTYLINVFCFPCIDLNFSCKKRLIPVLCLIVCLCLLPALSFLPCKHSLWPWWSVCTETQTDRWTCTGPLSAPYQSAALAPSGCTSGCQYHSPDLQRGVRLESIGWMIGWEKQQQHKQCILDALYSKHTKNWFL